jgi:mRNA interferase RelE/StbE
MKQPIRKLKAPDTVAKLIRNLHPHLKKKVKASLQTIVSDPCSGKLLKDELAGLRSFRVNRFRIIYRISDKKLIEIIAIGPRECIYEETFRLLKNMD